MNLMRKIFLKFIITYSLCISPLFIYTGCALFDFESEVQDKVIVSNYEKAESLIFNRKFEKALPLLELVLKQSDKDYFKALLLSARSYDQLAQPEKVILSLQELLGQDLDPVTQIKARSLLLKNLAKVKTDIAEHNQKKILFNFLKGQTKSSADDSSQDYMIALESLKLSLEFNCDQYCVEEILYLNEIQLQYLYIIEKDQVSAERAAESVKSRYEFFFSYLNQDHLDRTFRKKIAVGLLDSLRKIKSLQLNTQSQGSARAAQFIQSLVPIQKNIEGWLYQ